jgi:hypothetical protein
MGYVSACLCYVLILTAGLFCFGVSAQMLWFRGARLHRHFSVAKPICTKKCTDHTINLSANIKERARQSALGLSSTIL